MSYEVVDNRGKKVKYFDNVFSWTMEMKRLKHFDKIIAAGYSKLGLYYITILKD